MAPPPSRFVAILITGWWMLGVLFMLAAFVPRIILIPVLEENWIAEFALGFQFFVGAGLFLLSMQSWAHESSRWGLEILAWPLLTAAWIQFTIFGILESPRTLSLLIGTACSLASTVRFVEVLIKIRRTRANVLMFESHRLED